MANGKTASEDPAQTVETTLGLLNAIEGEREVTQRGLSARLGVALGLTNAMVKRCVKKGLLKVKDAPARRYAYYLTPKGFREKSRLTAEYLSLSLNFFRRARGEYAEALTYCANRGWKRVVLFGASDLAEIVTLEIETAGVEVVAVIDPARNDPRFSGLPVVRSLAEAMEGRVIDAVVVTDTADPQGAFERVRAHFPIERIITPPLLHVSRNGNTGGRG